MSDNLIEVSNLVKHFEISGGIFSRNKRVIKAVDGIDFEIKAGESLGLVGQSGCGKTTTARSLCLLDPKTSGDVNFYNSESQEMESIDEIDDEGLRQFRRNMQMIFQDPYESLNPRWTIKDIIKEPLDIHNIGDLKDREEAVIEILKTVGLTPPQNYLSRYPHEISGGQRQRVSIARTLIMKPKFVICDEPTSMLDVSIRISIMDLMLNLAKELNVSYLYITHDLAVARYMCNRIAVMFNGKIVEIAESEELLQNPIHPYTKRLISSIPIPDPNYKRERYEVNYDELDKIISSNPDKKMIDIGFNSILIRATKDLVEVAKKFNLDFSDLSKKITMSEESLIKFYKEEEQSFFSYDFKNHNLIKVDAISNYFILFADLGNKEINNKIISKLKKYNSQREYFFTTVNPKDKTFEETRYWRGPVWINSNWIIYQAVSYTHLTLPTKRIV